MNAAKFSGVMFFIVVRCDLFDAGFAWRSLYSGSSLRDPLEYSLRAKRAVRPEGFDKNIECLERIFVTGRCANRLLEKQKLPCFAKSFVGRAELCTICSSGAFEEAPPQLHA